MRSSLQRKHVKHHHLPRHQLKNDYKTGNEGNYSEGLINKFLD